MAANTRCSALERNAHDAYTQWAWLPCGTFVSAFGLKTLLTPRPPLFRQEGSLVSVSRDTGVVLPLAAEIPPCSLNLHFFSATALLALVQLQKFSAVAMYHGSGSQVDGIAKKHVQSGYVTAAMMIGMGVSGIVAGKTIQGKNAFAFNVLFGVPWLFWGIELVRSARSKSWMYHAYLGNMALKGTIAVPLARVLIALCQKWMVPLSGYYFGICLASIIVGMWELNDWCSYRRALSLQ